MTISTSYSSTLSQLSDYLNGTIESFETWNKIKDSIVSLKALFSSAAATHANFSRDAAAITAPLVKYINSDRTSLAKEAIDLSAHLALRLKSDFAALANQICPALIQTLGKTNKIYRSQGSAALSTIIANVKSVVIVRQICPAAVCKSTIARPLGAKLFQELVGSFSAQLLLQGHKDIEKVFSQGLADPVLDIKEVFRATFQTYVHKLPSRLDHLTKSLPKEVLKFFDQSRAIPSTQIIQVATHSVKSASQLPSSVQAIKKTLSIQAGNAASSSNMASSISSVSKLCTKPASIQLSKDSIQTSSVSSSSATAHSGSSTSRLQLKRGTIINEKIPDYSHIKSKVCQGRAASVKALPTCQRPSIVKSASIPYKSTQACSRVAVFSQSSKYALASTKKAPSQKPAGAVSQKTTTSKEYKPYSQSLLSQKLDGAASQQIPSSKKPESYSQSLLSRKLASHRSISHIVSNQTVNNGYSNPSQRIVGSNPDIAKAPYHGAISRNASQALQSVPDTIQVSKSTSAVISQSTEASVVSSSSTSKRSSSFTIEEKDIKHRKLG